MLFRVASHFVGKVYNLKVDPDMFSLISLVEETKKKANWEGFIPLDYFKVQAVFPSSRKGIEVTCDRDINDVFVELQRKGLNKVKFLIDVIPLLTVPTHEFQPGSSEASQPNSPPSPQYNTLQPTPDPSCCAQVNNIATEEAQPRPTVPPETAVEDDEDTIWSQHEDIDGLENMGGDVEMEEVVQGDESHEDDEKYGGDGVHEDDEGHGDDEFDEVYDVYSEMDLNYDCLHDCTSDDSDHLNRYEDTSSSQGVNTNGKMASNLNGMLYRKPGNNEKIKFETGLVFDNLTEYRKALKDFVLQGRFEIKRVKNDMSWHIVKCAADGCPWRLHAAPIILGGTYQIKNFNDQHTCQRGTRNSEATAGRVADKFENDVRSTSDMMAKGKKHDRACGAVDKIVLKDAAIMFVESPKNTGMSTGSEVALAENAARVSDTGCSTRDEMAVVEIPSNMQTVAKPLSLLSEWLCPQTVVVDSSGRTVNHWNDAKGGLNKIFMELTANESSNRTPDENRCLPYVETSSMLKAIMNSIEIFQRMPQKPHFHPLKECKEMYREGLAIGYIVTFANVVKQTSKLQINDPESIFNSISETLLHLEFLGFDVNTVQNRLTELQLMKARREQLQEESKEFGHQIMECTDEQTKTMAEFDDIVEKMNALEERKMRLISMKEKNDLKMTELKLNADVCNQDIQSVQFRFENLAAAPW